MYSRFISVSLSFLYLHSLWCVHNAPTIISPAMGVPVSVGAGRLFCSVRARRCCPRSVSRPSLPRGRGRTCRACDGHLVKTDEEIVCVACGWRGYPTTHHHRLSPRYRAQRRVLASAAWPSKHRRVARATRAAPPPLPRNTVQRHRELTNAAARARTQSRRADSALPLLRAAGRHARLLRQSHRRRHNAQRQSRQRAGRT